MTTPIYANKLNAWKIGVGSCAALAFIEKKQLRVIHGKQELSQRFSLTNALMIQRISRTKGVRVLRQRTDPPQAETPSCRKLKIE